MFHPLKLSNKKDLPVKFTYPFNYQVHPICELAAVQLQEKLKLWKWDDLGLGKMFGVLVVKNIKGETGYLCAYSGYFTNKLDRNFFVPPIYDVQAENNFFQVGESQLVLLNKKIKSLEESPEMEEAKANLAKIKADNLQKLNQAKEQNKKAKAIRDSKRTAAEQNMQAGKQQQILEALIAESQREKSALRQLKELLQKNLRVCEQAVVLINEKIDKLKQQRKLQSANLQKQLFEQYVLLNANGQSKGIAAIFKEFNSSTPPAAAGDCALPRLLQYAYSHNMHPMAMAEFWWGKSPNTVIRKQGYYYASCKGKCEPILSHMLKGLIVDDNPQPKVPEQQIEVLFEDAFLLAINKPSGMLSAPGKVRQKCVLDHIKEIRADLSTSYLVHRLDMATSGILLIAKSKNTHEKMQKLFLKRAIKKRYEALLDGKLEQDSGVIELPLRVDLDNRPQQMVCYDYGKKAETKWEKIGENNNETRVVFYPITGRTHQLRVHAAHSNGLGTAIIGDELYGKKAKRLMLHAASIEFFHPETNEYLKLTCPVPF